MRDRPAAGSSPGGPRARGARPSPSARTATCARCRSSTPRPAGRGRPAACPGACAPSTSVSTPRRSSSRTIAATGITSAVGDVTWLTSASRVRGVTASRYASTTCDGSAIGNGIRARRRVAPSRSAAAPKRVERRVVLVVAGEQLVARPEAERREDRGDARRRVGHEGEAVGIGAEERGDLRARLVEVALELAAEEPRRLALDPVPPGALGLEDGLRARAERPVVEVRDVRLEQPRRAIEGAVRTPGDSSPPHATARAVTRCRGSRPAARAGPSAVARAGPWRPPSSASYLRRLGQPGRRLGVTSMTGRACGRRRPRTRASRSGPATNGATNASTRIGSRNRDPDGEAHHERGSPTA